MAYVPIVPPTQTQPPSPRTRELAGLLAKVLEEYTKAHPSTTKAEIRAAVRLAQMSSGSSQAPAATVISLALGLVVLFLGFGLVYFRGAGDVDPSAALPVIIAVVIGVLLVVLAVARAKSG